MNILQLHEIDAIEDLFIERKRILGRALSKIENATQIIEVGTTLTDAAPKKKEPKIKPVAESQN